MCLRCWGATLRAVHEASGGPRTRHADGSWPRRTLPAADFTVRPALVLTNVLKISEAGTVTVPDSEPGPAVPRATTPAPRIPAASPSQNGPGSAVPWRKPQLPAPLLTRRPCDTVLVDGTVCGPSRGVGTFPKCSIRKAGSAHLSRGYPRHLQLWPACDTCGSRAPWDRGNERRASGTTARGGEPDALQSRRPHLAFGGKAFAKVTPACHLSRAKRPNPRRRHMRKMTHSQRFLRTLQTRTLPKCETSPGGEQTAEREWCFATGLGKTE